MFYNDNALGFAACYRRDARIKRIKRIIYTISNTNMRTNETNNKAQQLERFEIPL